MPNSRAGLSPKTFRSRSRGHERSTSWALLTLLTVVSSTHRRAHAQEAVRPVPGFAVERLSASAPGGGWVVMDTLDIHRGLGAAMALSFGYARNPLRISGSPGSSPAVVSDRVIADWGASVTFERLRLYVNMNVPLLAKGTDCAAFGHAAAAPDFDLGTRPDTIADPRIGVDTLLFGDRHGRLRVGVGAQLLIPSGTRADYNSDETARTMVRVLFAGDSRPFTYAGHVGLHIRPLDDARLDGWPRGREQLFGVAAGLRFALGNEGHYSVVVGSEIYGETAYQRFLRAESSALEGLVTSWVESSSASGPQYRAKLAVGPGLSPHFGAPEWRMVAGIEVFDFDADR